MTHRSWVDKEGKLISQPTLTVEELQAIVDEAHGWQKKVACHAYNGIGLQRALDGGCDSIEHGLEIRISRWRRCSAKGPGIARRFPRITTTGRRRILRRENATARGPQSTKSHSRKRCRP